MTVTLRTKDGKRITRTFHPDGTVTAPVLLCDNPKSLDERLRQAYGKLQERLFDALRSGQTNLCYLEAECPEAK